MFVRELMTAKVISIGPLDSVATARQRLEANAIHHLLVVDADTVVGVVSYRDVIGRPDLERVASVMSRDVVTVDPDAPLRIAASKILGRTHGCLAVVDRGEIAGVLTTTDLLRAVSKPAHA